MRRRVKWSGIAKVSTFYPLDSIEGGAAKSRVGPHSRSPPLEAPSFRRHISGVKMAAGRADDSLLLPAISTPFLPSLLPPSLATQLCSSSFPCPARSTPGPPRGPPTAPSFISVQTKAPKWLECLRQMDPWAFFRALAQLRISVSKSKTVRRSEGRCSRHSPSPIRRRRRRRAN